MNRMKSCAPISFRQWIICRIVAVSFIFLNIFHSVSRPNCIFTLGSWTIHTIFESYLQNCCFQFRSKPCVMLDLLFSIPSNWRYFLFNKLSLFSHDPTNLWRDDLSWWEALCLKNPLMIVFVILKVNERIVTEFVKINSIIVSSCLWNTVWMLISENWKPVRYNTW